MANRIETSLLVKGLTADTYTLDIRGKTFVDGDIEINGNVNIVGTATTINTQTVQARDNKIELNYSGSTSTAIGGGIEILSGRTDGSGVSLTIDTDRDWNSNTGFNITGRTNDSTTNSLKVVNSSGTNNLVVRNDGNVGIGATFYSNQRIFQVSQESSFMSFGSLIGSSGTTAIYFNQTTPTSLNYTINSTSALTRYNATTLMDFRIVDTNKYRITSVNHEWNTSPQTSSGLRTIDYSFTPASHTSQSASTNTPNFRVLGNTRGWLGGNITNQYWNYFQRNNALFTTASTITNSYGLYVEAASASTNATITNNYAAGFEGDVNISGKTITTNLQITSGATSIGYIMVDYDGNGNAQWQPISVITGETLMSTSEINVSAYTATTSFDYYGTTYSSGPITIQLPDPSTIYNGYRITIKDETTNSSLNNITITTPSGNIDNSASPVVMTTNQMSLTLVVRNNNWWII